MYDGYYNERKNYLRFPRERLFQMSGGIDGKHARSPSEVPDSNLKIT